MSGFIVAKNSKLNNKISIYFFLLIIVFASMGLILNIVLTRRSALLGVENKLISESKKFLDVLSESINHKENLGISTNILVSQLINSDQFYQRSNIVLGDDNQYRGIDSRSGVYLSGKIELTQELQKEIDSTNYIWNLIPTLLLNEFNNYWYISNKGFIRISPSRWAYEISEDSSFEDSIYYSLGTPEVNPERSPRWTPVYFDTTIKRWMTSYIVPLYKGEKFLGVTGSDLYIDKLIKNLYEDINILIYDSSNTLIYNSLDNLDNNYQSYRYITEKFVFSNTGWSIRFYINETYFNNNSDRYQTYLIAIFIFLALLISIGSWFLVRKIVITPINRLSLAASDFNFSDEIKAISRRRDEIGTLAKSFLAMGDTITSQIREIKLESQDRVESEKKFRRLIENLGKEYFFYSYKTDLSFHYISESVEQMLGYSPEEFSLKFNDILISSDINREYLRLRDISIKGVKQPGYILELKSSKGEVKLIEVVETPIFNRKGHVVSVEGIAHDITEIKKAEVELKNHKENLEDIVVNRTKELENTLLELVESKKMASLGELVSGVAHEINTPVGVGVTASTHLTDITNEFYRVYSNNELSKSKFEKFIEEMLETSKIIFTNMVKAASLIKGFKEIAVDQTCNDIREFNLKDYIDEIVLSIHSEIKHTRHVIIVNVEESLRAKTYPGALSQIITNLIFNTIYHGFENKEEGVISIEAHEDNSNIIIIYRDNGKGIPQEIINKIYNPFFTTKRGKGGSGLGMNIVLNLVLKTLKGSIDCESEVGEGVTFKIKFPKVIEGNNGSL